SVHTDAIPQLLARTEQHRPDGEMQFVDQAGAQILPNSGDAAAEADVAAARCGGRLLQSCVDAFGDKAKLGASCHLKRRPWMVRQHKDGGVIRRLVAPPALPAVVRPRASYRTEHVAPKNPGADSGKALLRNSVVDPRFPVGVAMHLLPQTRGEKPLHQHGASDAERILEILVRTGTITVKRDGEALDAEFR